MTADTAQAHDRVSANWARAGVLFGLDPAARTPDLERLLLDTARFGRDDARLFTMAFTWLCMFGVLVAKHRLGRLVADELERAHWPVLGLLLDLVQQQRRWMRFNAVIRRCRDGVPSEGQPLFNVEARTEVVRRMAERSALPVSRPWNLWLRRMELKPDALRSADWIIQHNPTWRDRAELKGDLRASILVELADDPTAGRSQLELARRTGATRAAVRKALAALELARRIERIERGASKATVARSQTQTHAA